MRPMRAGADDHAPGAPRPWADAMRRAGGGGPRIAATYLLACAAGYAALRADVPLPWMLGPFFACGALSAAGVRLAYLPMGRELGQVAIGLAVGMRFTPATLAAMLTLLPAMLVSTLYVVVFTMLAALIMRPLANVDSTTAFFATAAGGMADMAVVAKEQGGAPNAVAIVHALRVSSVVALVPILVVSLATPGATPAAVPGASSNLFLVALALAAGTLVAFALKPTPLPNPWLVGPIFLGIAIGASGLLVLAVPPVLVVAAQIAIGTWLGCQFKRAILATLPRVAAAGFAVSVFMILAAAGGAVVLSAATSLPYATSFLALAPAAVTEMVLTAQAMRLDAEIVTAFHVMRIAIVSSTILLVFNLYQTLTGGRLGPRI